MAIRVKKPSFTSLDDVLTFGQYEGNTLREVLDADPSYVLWLEKAADLPVQAVDMAYDAVNPDVDRDYPVKSIWRE